MKTKLLPLFLGLLALAGSVGHAAQLGTGINYQGRLTDGGSPANGTHSFKYRLVSDAAGTTQIGPLLDLPNQNVSGGLFNAPLDFGAGAFNGQERWLEISVKTGGPGASQDYIKLSPQPLPPGGSSQFARIAGDVLDAAITGPRIAPLAITSGNLADGAVTAAKLGAGSVGSSQIADGSITATDIGNSQVVKSLNVSGINLRDNINLVGGQNVSLTPSGNTVTISSAGAGGAGIWTALNGNTYYNGGRVGIGTIQPSGALHVANGGVAVTGGSSPYSGAGKGVFIEKFAGWDLFGGAIFAYDYDAGQPLPLFLNSPGGNVGIGTLTPIAKLDVGGRVLAPQLSVAGDDLDQLTFSYAGQTAQMANYGVSRGPVNPGAGAPTVGLSGWAGLGLFTSAANRLWVTKEGNVGIGTSDPQAKLDVVGDVSWGTSLLKSDQGGAIELGNSSGNGNTPYLDFHYGVGAAQDFNVRLINDADGRLTCSGSLSVSTLTIRGGADLAEPFPMKEEQIDKGSVVVIDKEHPGQLKRSTHAYDRRVAGIVSGANGINPGIALKQEGTLDQGENVALTGRVYVKADASNGEIDPGDLLTTSDTPGHAMKVTEHAKAQGAILGKAMSALKAGTGLVLVLVTLQ